MANPGLEYPGCTNMSTEAMVLCIENSKRNPDARIIEMYVQLHFRNLSGEYTKKKCRRLTVAFRLGHPIAFGLGIMNTDCDGALAVLYDSFKRGHPLAAYVLAEHFSHKLDSVELHSFAATNGHAESMFKLYCHYEFRNVSLAIEWLERAADSGHLHAKYHLAMRYLNVSPRRPKDAFEILSRPVPTMTYRNSIEGAISYELGKCYELGIGTDLDVSAAKLWYRKGIEVEDLRCTLALGIFTGDNELILEAANAGFIEAQYRYAMRAESDVLKIAWLKIASDNGHRDATVELARMHLKGNKEHARLTLAKLVESHYPPAEYLCGCMLDRRDPVREALFLSAASQGHVKAMRDLGLDLEKSGRYRDARKWLLDYAQATFKRKGMLYCKRSVCLAISECYNSSEFDYDFVGDAFWCIRGDYEDLIKEHTPDAREMAIFHIINDEYDAGGTRIYANSIYEDAVMWLNDHPVEESIVFRGDHRHAKVLDLIKSSFPQPIAEEIIPCFVSFFLEDTPSVFGYECGAYPPAVQPTVDDELPAEQSTNDEQSPKRALEDTHSAKRQRLQ